MKVIRHEKLMKPETMTLSASPVVIWLDRQTELHIEPGDTAAQIAHEVRRHWEISQIDALQLATYWFAIGTRVQSLLGGGWRRIELTPDRNRRYTVKDLPAKK